MALKPSGRERQHRIEPVERLDRRLLIDAEHCSMGRGVQVQPDHVGRLGLEVRIVGSHVTFQPVWLEPVLGPDARHHHVRNPQHFSELAGAPVRRAIARGLLRPSEHPCLDLRGILGWSAAAVARIEPREAFALKAPLPAADVIRRTRQPLADRVPAQAFVKHHDQSCALHIGRLRCARARQRQQRSAFFRSQTEDRVHAS